MLTPYYAFAKKGFLSRSAYRFDHFIGIFNTIVRIFIFWEIYQALYGGRSEVDGITMSMVTTNFILSMCLEEAFFIDDFYLPYHIGTGSIATELLLPISFKGRMLANNMGIAAFKLIFHFAPALIVAVIFMGINPPRSIPMFLLFVVSALLGYGVLWTISFSVQMCSFWIINVWSVVTIKNVLVNVLSGSMIPLWFMPDWMEPVMNFTPFSSIYFTPVQIYLGQLEYGQIAQKLLISAVWILVIYLIGNILWEKGKKKLVVQGG
ncbi:MAG: ABC transporter permease [Lachnospiraceae bacterium]|nr:ABC transporter permease [Lachnospiraceae bacterium]